MSNSRQWFRLRCGHCYKAGRPHNAIDYVRSTKSCIVLRCRICGATKYSQSQAAYRLERGVNHGRD